MFGSHLVVRDNECIDNVSPVLAELVKKRSEMKNEQSLQSVARILILNDGSEPEEVKKLMQEGY